MTWPFENDTSAITKKLAKKSLQSEKRRNLMVVIAVALAAFLICFTGIVSTSLTQMQRNQVVDTYEAVWLGVEENDIETLKGLPEFERVGGYYMLGEELSEQGYHASYVYCDAQMMEIAKAQMELLEGRVPEKANEVVVSEYFLSTYGNNAKIGDTVTLDTESFHGDYVVTGIMDSVNEKEANTCAIILSNAALTEWNGFDPAGYRAYVHFKNSDQLGEELMTSYCREIAEEYQLPMPKMNSKYFVYASKSFDFALMAGVIAIVLIGGYIVIQSIFRISINDKIKSYGQLRTIGATPKQIKRIVKREGRKLGSIGILIGKVLGVCGGFQMLGMYISDEDGTEAGGNIRGIGLLPVVTEFSSKKHQTRTQAVICASEHGMMWDAAGIWENLNGIKVSGYEIHMGESTILDSSEDDGFYGIVSTGRPFSVLSDGKEDGCVNGNVCGTYIHGIFDNEEFLLKLLKSICERKGITYEADNVISVKKRKEKEYDKLADMIRTNMDIEMVYKIIGL